MDLMRWAAAVLAGTAAASVSADVVVVRVYNFDFSVAPAGQPAVDATIRVGDTVQWRWDGGTHDTIAATGYSEVWASPINSQIGQTFEHTFTHVGTFPYYCSLHGADNGDGTVSGMSGTITVVCAADMNQDGQLTLSDFVEFRNLYVAGDMRADFDRNGMLTLADFIGYRNAYTAGCPS